MGMNVVQKLIKSHLLSGTMTARKREDPPGMAAAGVDHRCTGFPATSFSATLHVS